MEVIHSSTMTSTDLAAITGIERHYFRIADSDTFQCACCKRDLQAAYESFSSPTGDDGMSRSGVASFCVPCVQKGGRDIVLEGVRNMVAEILANEPDAWTIELWNAILAQFEAGDFEIISPKSEYELATLITEATARHTNTLTAALATQIKSMHEETSAIVNQIKGMNEQVADFLSEKAL